MEKKLLDHLIEGETVLWTGKPEFVVLDKTNKPFIVAKAAVVIAAMSIFVLYYLNFVSVSGTGAKGSVFFVVAALTAMVVLPEILDANKLKNSLYVVTDRRLIAMVGGDMESVEFSKIKEYDFAEDADGQISLLCGERALASKPRLRRLYTVLGAVLTEDKLRCERFVMYGVPEQEKLADLLSKHIEIT